MVSSWYHFLPSTDSLLVVILPNAYLHLFASATILALVSSGASTTAPDSPSLASQPLMSDETAVAATAPITITPNQQTIHAAQFPASANERDVPYPLDCARPFSRSTRIRAFRAFQYASWIKYVSMLLSAAVCDNTVPKFSWSGQNFQVRRR